MLTYHFETRQGPLYRQLYDYIRRDMESGKLKTDEKMPSKRAFARNLGVSTITVEAAYGQLISEGYLYTQPKRGYFVSDLASMLKPDPLYDSDSRSPHPAPSEETIRLPEGRQDVWFDFSSGHTDAADFPFSIWAKLMRETLSWQEQELLETPPCCGVRQLREAIAGHLASFRGMTVDPDQIIVGSGTEYLYSLLIRLLGQDKIYCIENPGYRKLLMIYRSNQAACRFADVDSEGMVVEQLRQADADIAHISPNHHFPTGVTMSTRRRFELLDWAAEKPGRYIIEDDYDSDFRIKGQPIPPLQCIDRSGKVIYMNTFSKSLTSAIRISYMVLPPHLANAFYARLGFYSCTVPTFDQYALASFIGRGYFEKHINRMRLVYGRRRAKVLETAQKVFAPSEASILENDSGLHMLLLLHTSLPDTEVKERLARRSIRIRSIMDYDMRDRRSDRHQFLINYAGMNLDRLEEACGTLREICGFCV